MKNLFFLFSFTCFFVFSISAQDFSSRDKRTADNFTGKRFDSFGKPLKKQNKKKQKTTTDKFYEGDMKKKSHPIGMDKDRKKRKTNIKGKKRKKGCNCPGK